MLTQSGDTTSEATVRSLFTGELSATASGRLQTFLDKLPDAAGQCVGRLGFGALVDSEDQNSGVIGFLITVKSTGAWGPNPGEQPCEAEIKINGQVVATFDATGLVS